MKLEKLLDQYRGLVNDYYACEYTEVETIVQLMKSLSCVLASMETLRTEAYKKHNAILFKYTGPVSRGQIEADDRVPELYMLRRIMNAGYRVVDAMRSNISFVKMEMQNSV